MSSTNGIMPISQTSCDGNGALCAINTTAQNRENHSNLVNTTTGGRKSRKKYYKKKSYLKKYKKPTRRIGGSGDIIVSDAPNGSTQNNTDMIVKMNTIAVNANAEKQYDIDVVKGGCGTCNGSGTTNILHGGSSKWKCKSGGRRKRRKTMKNKKNRTKK
jgi:hypothetical protein